MCGITGILKLNRDNNKTISNYLNLMKHRGPDASGIFADEHGGIGVNRLWVRGAETVNLPQRITINGKISYAVINGQIYGDAVGLEEIFSIASDFRPSSCMYAFASYAPEERTITLKRDFFGIKPLYYKVGNSFTFSSEIPPLICENSTINQKKAFETIALGTSLDNDTIYNNIKSVPRNGLIEAHQHKGSICLSEKFFPLESPKKYTFEEVKKFVREKIRKSIISCLDSNKTIGLAISGGLDSNILAFELNDMGVENIETISLKIEDSADGITDLKNLGLPKKGAWKKWKHHHQTFNSHDFPKYLETISSKAILPHRMSSFPMYYKLAELAKENNISVLLSGEGADEIFLGYNSYKRWIKRINQNLSIHKNLKDFILPNDLSDTLKQISDKDFLSSLDDSIEKFLLKIQNKNILSSLISLEAYFSLEPLLIRTDHCLMQNSIEGRFPFLDTELYSAIIDNPELTLFDGETSKPLLREIYSDFFNSYNIPKIAFRAPLSSWIGNQLNQWAINSLKENQELLSKFGFTYNGITLIINQIKNKNPSVYTLAFSLISFAYILQNKPLAIL